MLVVGERRDDLSLGVLWDVSVGWHSRSSTIARVPLEGVAAWVRPSCRVDWEGSVDFNLL